MLHVVYGQNYYMSKFKVDQMANLLTIKPHQV